MVLFFEKVKTLIQVMFVDGFYLEKENLFIRIKKIQEKKLFVFFDKVYKIK